MSDVVITGHADACVCCGNLQAATLSCRIRGGTATLCGYSEYSGYASTPPKKYRRKTYSGVITSTARSGCGTGTLIYCDETTYSGYRLYDLSNCATSLTALQQYRTSDCFPNTCALGSITNFTPPEDWSNFAGVTSTFSATVWSQDGNGNCYATAACSAGFGIADGTRTQTLSDEDTNDDAIARLLAGSGGTWGSWIVQGATGCTGSPPSCCLARYQERTSGFSFIYQESQFRVTASGLDPSTSYNARVEIYRRTYGSGSYALYQTMIVSDTTDGSGNFSADGDVPNDEGFESYAANAFIVIPS